MPAFPRHPPREDLGHPEQVLRIADQAGQLGGPSARLLIITAAWTGCRWGELTGLHRRNVDLQRGVITIDREYGALQRPGQSPGTAPGEAPQPRRPLLAPVKRDRPRRARQLDIDQVQKLIDGYESGSTVYEHQHRVDGT